MIREDFLRECSPEPCRKGVRRPLGDVEALRRWVGTRAAGERCREKVGCGLNLKNQVVKAKVKESCSQVA